MINFSFGDGIIFIPTPFVVAVGIGFFLSLLIGLLWCPLIWLLWLLPLGIVSGIVVYAVIFWLQVWISYKKNGGL